MEFERVWQTAWKDDAIDETKPKEKTTSKLKLDHGDCKTSWTYSNEKFAMSGDGKLLTGDYKSNLTGGAEYKFLKDEWKLTGLLTLATPDFSGAKINTSVSIEIKSYLPDIFLSLSSF